MTAAAPRLPPQNRDAERGVIGGVIRDPDTLPRVREVVRPESMAWDAHQKIFGAICAIADRGDPLDLVLLSEELRKRGHIQDVGGAAYLAELWEAVPTGANAEYYAVLVRDCAARRTALRIANELTRDALHPTGSAEELLSEAERKLASVRASTLAKRNSRFHFIDSAAFAGGDYRPEWHIKGVLVRGQPGVIAGPTKALKTNTSIDAAVSLAAGLSFLGKFEVPKKTRVAIVSGESGAHTLQETASRICRAKGIQLADLGDYLDWCFTLPAFSDLDVMAEFARELTKLNAEVVIIDPVYLALGAVDAKNLFEAGAAFRVVAEVLLAAGCTPILIHHANRQLQVGEPMELQHLAYTGLEQFARQFMLLNRRERYQGNGIHDLWLRIGGSAGHGGLWNLHIEEGVIDENFAGREWNITVQTRSEVQEDVAGQREARKREEARRRFAAEDAAALDAIDAERAAGHPGATKNAMASRCHFSGGKVDEIVSRLLEEGVIEEVGFEKECGNGGRRKVKGYCRVSRESLLPE